MRTKIKQILREKINEISVPGGDRLRLPQEPNISEETYEELKNIDAGDIDLSVRGDDGFSTIFINVRPKVNEDVSESLVLNIQLIGDQEPQLYQPHISIHESLQGIGLATKIYETFIHEFGHLYSGSGRRQSGIVEKVWQKLDNTSGISCELSDEYNVCVCDQNPQKEEVLKKVSGS